MTTYDEQNKAQTRSPRRQWLAAGVAAGAALLLPWTALAQDAGPLELLPTMQTQIVSPVCTNTTVTGSTPGSLLKFDGDHENAFTLTNRTKAGFLTDLWNVCLGQPLARDLTLPYPADGLSPSNPQLSIDTSQGSSLVNVVAAIDRVKWRGRPTDPMEFEAYMSLQNATILSQCAAQQLAAKQLDAQQLAQVLASLHPGYELPMTKLSQATAAVSAFSWWLGEYSQTQQTWYEKSTPQSSSMFAGVVNPEMQVDLQPVTPAQPYAGLTVYKVHFKIDPNGASQQFTIFDGNSSVGPPTVKQWGLVTGKACATAVLPNPIP